MPESSPENEEVELKPAEGAQPEAETGAKDASAESPPAEKDGQQKGDMLSAVKAALSPEKEEAPASANPGSEKEASEAAASGEEDDDSADFSEEEKARLSQKAKRRFHKLAGEVTDLTKKLGDLEPQAQQFQKMAQYVADAGLSVDEVNRGFDVMRAIKQDPLRAFEMMKPVFEQLQQLVGEVLPQDLQQAVNLGHISEAHARELARSRSAAALHQQRAQRIEQRNSVERQQAETSNRWTSAASATTEWENSKAKSDPDWKLKQPRVVELVELEVLKQTRANPNFVPTTEDAVNMANAALAKVNEEWKRLRPAPKQITAITDVASTRSEAKPKSAVEAAKQGLARMAG